MAEPNDTDNAIDRELGAEDEQPVEAASAEDEELDGTDEQHAEEDDSLKAERLSIS